MIEKYGDKDNKMDLLKEARKYLLKRLKSGISYIKNGKRNIMCSRKMRKLKRANPRILKKMKTKRKKSRRQKVKKIKRRISKRKRRSLRNKEKEKKKMRLRIKARKTKKTILNPEEIQRPTQSFGLFKLI
jgi:hypothetical protein